MGKSGNPRKAAEQEAMRPSSISDIKKRKGGIFEMPSGLYFKLKNPGGMQSLLAAGLLPNSLMGIVQQSLNAGKPMDPKDIVKDGGVDPQFIKDMTELLDKLAVLCIVEPNVQPVPEDEDLRDDNIVYADEIDENDKMFVFQWVTGGTSDLEQFRRGHASSMDSLGKVAEAGQSAQ